MKSKGFNAYNKYIILEHGIKSDNISETCELFNISRTTFYNWMRDYERYGVSGLEPKKPKKPKMPNKVSKEVEREILRYVTRYPTDGPKRIYYELKSEGYNIGETGIYNVLKRKGLTKREDRIRYSKDRGDIYLPKSKDKEIRKILNVEDIYPGYLVLQKIDYIGNFENIGKIYQYSVYDIGSKWGGVKLFNSQNDIDVWKYFELKLIYLIETFNLTIENLITDKDKKYLPFFIKDDPFIEDGKDYGINHIYVDMDNRKEFAGIIEFNEMLSREFFSPIEANAKLDSFDKIDEEMTDFVRNYNFNYRAGTEEKEGLTPVELILERAKDNKVDFDKLPIWILALINSSGGGDTE